MLNNYAVKQEPNRSSAMATSSKYFAKPSAVQLMPPNPYKGNTTWQKNSRYGQQSPTSRAGSSRSDSSVYSVSVKGIEGPNTTRGFVNETTAAQEEKKKKSDLEEVRFLTGHIEKILKWHKLLNSFCHYEVIAPVISIQEGNVRMQQILLLRDKTGPVLKVIHYLYDRIVLSEFFLGQKIRCVGRMIGVNTLQAVNIREATSVEISALPRITKKQIVVLGTIVLIGLVVFGICFGLILNKEDDGFSAFNELKEPPPKGGIATNGYECAEIGRDILRKGGSVADAGIAAMFCEGVAMPQSTGLGGGFLMTIYTRATGKVESLNAREVAPLAATPDMYDKNPELSETGGLAVAVPGELRGYGYIYDRYGKLPWRQLVQPTIDLCRQGNVVTPFLEELLENRKDFLKREKDFREIFIDPKTGEPYKKGDFIKRTKLAETLELIAEEGPDVLYNGSLTKGFVRDIQEKGGIITEQDMNLYKPEWQTTIVSKLPDNQTLYATPLPGSGLVLTYIINLLKDNLDLENIHNLTDWQRITESFKFAYGKRTLLGDANFVPGIDKIIEEMTSEEYAYEIRKKIMDNDTSDDPMYYGANYTVKEDHGTAHIAILAPNGDAISITGTINLIFGAKIISPSTGIILNDEMDDFSTTGTNYFNLPSSPSNFIQPGKRPLSSMSPSIIVDKHGDVRLVVGAAGGSKITTSVAHVAMRHLWFDLKLKEAIDEPRLHHQLFPMKITFESTFPMPLIIGLTKDIGHDYEIKDPTNGFAAVTGVSNYNGTVEAATDYRRPGSAITFQ